MKSSLFKCLEKKCLSQSDRVKLILLKERKSYPIPIFFNPGNVKSSLWKVYSPFLAISVSVQWSLTTCNLTRIVNMFVGYLFAALK